MSDEKKIKMEWVDELPPSPKGRPSLVEEFAQELKKNPGRWAVYKKLPKGKRWTGGSVYGRRNRSIQWASRTANNVTTVYARWIGETE